MRIDGTVSINRIGVINPPETVAQMVRHAIARFDELLANHPTLRKESE
jgi:hypothetical protein